MPVARTDRSVARFAAATHSLGAETSFSVLGVDHAVSRQLCEQVFRDQFQGSLGLHQIGPNLVSDSSAS